MGRIIAVEYLTLDGVFEEPAWTQPYFDEAVGAYQGEAMQWADALLMGRVTYDGMSQAWPAMGERPVDRRRRHELDRQVRPDLDAHRADVERDVPAGRRRRAGQRAQGGTENLLIYGSGQLIETLRAADLIDEYRLLIAPVVLGSGRRLFTGATPSTFAVARPRPRRAACCCSTS